MEGKTQLFANNHWIADFKQLKHVDYMNLIRMTNERRTNQEWFIDPLIKARMKRRDLIMNKREAESIRMMIDRKQQEITERTYKARQAKEQKAREEMERSIQLQREDEQRRRNRKVYSFLPASWNTFQDKEKIKKAGFKFDRTCGWVIVKTFDSEEVFNAFHDELEGKAQAEGLKGILYMEADAYEVFSSARDAQEGIREGMKESGF